MALESRAERIPLADGAGFVEVGTIVHEGREYAAGGAQWAPKAGVVSGYPHRDPTTGRWVLRSWAGETLCDLLQTGHWLAAWSPFGRDRYAWRATIDGQRFCGTHGGGEGCFLRLRPSRAAS